MQINQFGTVTNNKNGFLPTRENRIESLDNQKSRHDTTVSNVRKL